MDNESPVAQETPQDDAAKKKAGAELYYKSQKEVDAAFGRRLEAERRKWGKQQPAAAPVQPQAAQEPIESSATQPGGSLDPAQDAAAQPDQGFARIALKLLAEEEDIKQVYPQFDLESFLGLGEGVQGALLSGKSLWSVFSSVYGETLRRQAEQAALERIRDRNAGIPDVLRGGGAAGSVSPDYANMPTEQFQKLRKAYEAEMRMGKKVKP
jgi:hypothetical protein